MNEPTNNVQSNANAVRGRTAAIKERFTRRSSSPRLMLELALKGRRVSSACVGERDRTSAPFYQDPLVCFHDAHFQPGHGLFPPVRSDGGRAARLFLVHHVIPRRRRLSSLTGKYEFSLGATASCRRGSIFASLITITRWSQGATSSGHRREPSRNLRSRKDGERERTVARRLISSYNTENGSCMYRTTNLKKD